jgi:hypothetical protein
MAFGLAFAVIIGVIIGLAIALIPVIFYLLTLSRTLKQCAPHNRRMEPGEVWMMFIPLFGLVWHFITVGRLADSLAAEFRQRNIPVQEARPGYNMGMTFLILRVCGVIPFLGILTGIAGLVCWIIYWSKIAAYKRQLEQQQFQFGAGNPYQFQQPNAGPYQQPYANQYPPNQYPPQQ